ncbi:MAG: manganese efflux pump MntP family protein [Candidatus Eremiobacteraeota bacterium]|nr:manganese efflux pump MntP family protein [Candidatus Eremiobacteraeota bacterium]
MTARVLAFVMPLGFDTLAVAIALGLRGMDPLRPAIVFAVFETVMPIAGILIGQIAGIRFTVPAQVVGGLALIGVAIHSFREASLNEDESGSLSFGSIRAAAAAGIGISMDELVVGFPMGTAHLPISTLLGAIGTQAFVVSAGGILIGRRIGEVLGRRAWRFSGIAAGMAFSAVGLWLIVEALARG